MSKVPVAFHIVASFLLVWLAAAPSQAVDESSGPETVPPTASVSTGSRSSYETSPLDFDRLDRIEAAVIHPYKTANVGTEVKGILEKVNYDEGDAVSKDAVVVEISAERYELMARKAAERVKGLELVLRNAEEDLRIKEELLPLNAATQQDVIKARTQAEIERQRLSEAREELKIALLDLELCRVKAPFSGYLAVRYKQPDEVVNQYDNLFALVDSSKVYAVANVPETQLTKFLKGANAVFIHSSGKKFEGTVDKSGVLIDPQSKTLKVYVLIENAQGELQIGTAGSLEVVE